MKKRPGLLEVHSGMAPLLLTQCVRHSLILSTADWNLQYIWVVFCQGKEAVCLDFAGILEDSLAWNSRIMLPVVKSIESAQMLVEWRTWVSVWHLPKMNKCYILSTRIFSCTSESQVWKTFFPHCMHLKGRVFKPYVLWFMSRCSPKEHGVLYARRWAFQRWLDHGDVILIGGFIHCWVYN